MALALLIATVMVGGLAAIWVDRGEAEVHAQSLGVNLASTLAVQGTEAMLQPDPLHLAVLTNRLSALPLVTRARFLDANREPIADSGAVAEGKHLEITEPISIGGVTTGYASVTIDKSAFAREATAQQVAATLLLVLLCPVLAMVLAEFRARPRQPVPIVEMPEPAAPEKRPVWFATINLYNQLAFENEQRKAVLQSALSQCAHVAHLYEGEARAVTGIGIIVEFSRVEDAAFKAVCASFLLLRVLEATEPEGEFRIALHQLAEASASDPSYEVLADATLLAALARENTLLATPDFVATLNQPERLKHEPLTHPMLEDVELVDRECTSITGLSTRARVLIEQQSAVVLGYSTPMESTL